MGRLIMVSNRLPVSLRRGRDGAVEVIRSSGGLVAALGPIHESGDGLWLGNMPDGVDAEVEKSLSDRRYVTITVSAAENRSYYLGYSNSSIWPLFHYLPERSEFNRSQFTTYREINQRFADRIISLARPNDTIWIHDYHLMLVPSMVREQLPKARIGFFLHIPFPSSELFRLLPEREEILRGLLGSDVVGFHTYDYARHFVSSVLRVLGIHMREGIADIDGRSSAAATFPLGIDAPAWQKLVLGRSAETRLRNLQTMIRDRKVILGVERLDYSKGIPLRLRAFRTLLQQHPNLRGKVVFIQIAAPSRGEIPSYNAQKLEIEQIVGQINGEFGSPGSVPIHYQNRSSPPVELAALYRLADVFMVTPLRDGMNLMAKEFIACQEDRNGVLVLSEFAGAASELGEALRVNPWDIEGTADTLYEALHMKKKEKSNRIASMSERIRDHDVHRWARRAISAIERPAGPARPAQAPKRPGELASEIMPDLKSARRPVVFLDYDGTLREFTERPEDASPTESITSLLETLQQARCTTVLLSGRDVDTMESWFGQFDIVLVAEHGTWTKTSRSAVWAVSEALLPGEWKISVRAMLDEYVSRTPGASVEEKSGALVWHYRAADNDIGSWQARELTTQLEEYLANDPVEVMEGARNIEVRQQGINKGTAFKHIDAMLGPFDFYLAMGDDTGDEDLFNALPPGAHSIQVGDGRGATKYKLSNPSEARAFLRALFAESSDDVT